MARRLHRLEPFLFLLVNVEQEAQRLDAVRTGAQLLKHFLGTVKEAGLEIVLPQFKHRRKTLLAGQVAALEQVLVHANRPFGLTAPAKQAAEGKMQLYGLRVELDHLDEGIDGLVRLLVEQEIEAAKVGARQRLGLGDQVAYVDARGKPAEAEKQRKTKQPPVFEFRHVRRASF